MQPLSKSKSLTRKRKHSLMRKPAPYSSAKITWLRVSITCKMRCTSFAEITEGSRLGLQGYNQYRPTAVVKTCCTKKLGHLKRFSACLWLHVCCLLSWIKTA